MPLAVANDERGLIYEVTAAKKSEEGNVERLKLLDPHTEKEFFLDIPEEKQSDPRRWKSWLKGLGYAIGNIEYEEE